MSVSREQAKRRWWRFSLRSMLAFTAVYAGYVTLMLWFWSLFGKRALFIPEAPIAIECLLLFLLCAAAGISARCAYLIEIDFDWKRGCLRICLALFAIALFALPFVWLFLMACLSAVLSSI